MLERLETFYNRLALRRAQRRWERLADRAGDMDLASLKTAHGQATRLSHPLNRLVHQARHRLALPVIGSNAFQVPPGTDWAWRPEIWHGPIFPPGHAAIRSKTRLGHEVRVFHDCNISETSMRQLRNNRESDLAPFGLRLDVFRFDGGFVSLSVDLPPEAIAGLQKRHVLRAEASIEVETPLEIFMRLNIQHGPNTEQIVREMPLGENDTRAEFDLAYTNINERRIERAWADLIFEGPEMNQIILRDLTFSRRPRNEL